MDNIAAKRWGLNGFTLKCIAMGTMLTDHMGMLLFPEALWMRYVGRLAFPIFCFLLVEGAVHTSDMGKYLRRLFLFALISEIPFDLVRTGTLWDQSGQNVFFTLFLGLLSIYVLERFKSKNYSIILVVLIVCAAEYARTDYGMGGIVIILCFYVLYRQPFVKSVLFAAINLFIYSGLQKFALFSLIPILCYNGKQGPKVKYVFYCFYPVHLLILFLIRVNM